MISELCKELNNWFNYTQPKMFGDFVVTGGAIDSAAGNLNTLLQNGQYFRIVGSVFNDGVYQYPAEGLTDERFEGAVWAMAVPPEIIALSDEIDAWKEKYGGIDSEAMSPFTSESFGGYSYTKGSRASNSTGSGGGGNGWESVFADRLNRWRKL